MKCFDVQHHTVCSGKDMLHNFYSNPSINNNRGEAILSNFFLKIFNLHNYYIYRYSFCYQLITIFLHSNFSDSFDIIYLNIQLLRVEKYRNSLVVEGDSISLMTKTLKLFLSCKFPSLLFV